jgi:hypothetical protein
MRFFIETEIKAELYQVSNKDVLLIIMSDKSTIT